MIKNSHNLIGAAVIALLVAGCGGSGGSTTVTTGEVTVHTASLTKKQFVKQADAICETDTYRSEEEFGAYVKRQAKLVGKRYGGSLTAILRRFAPQIVDAVLIPTYERQIEQLESLGAPSGDEKEVAAVLAAMRNALDEGRRRPYRFLRSSAPFADAKKLAKAYGFAFCAETQE